MLLYRSVYEYPNPRPREDEQEPNTQHPYSWKIPFCVHDPLFATLDRTLFDDCDPSAQCVDVPKAVQSTLNELHIQASNGNFWKTWGAPR